MRTKFVVSAVGFRFRTAARVIVWTLAIRSSTICEEPRVRLFSSMMSFEALGCGPLVPKNLGDVGAQRFLAWVQTLRAYLAVSDTSIVSKRNSVRSKSKESQIEDRGTNILLCSERRGVSSCRLVPFRLETKRFIQIYSKMEVWISCISRCLSLRGARREPFWLFWCITQFLSLVSIYSSRVSSQVSYPSLDTPSPTAQYVKHKKMTNCRLLYQN